MLTYICSTTHLTAPAFPPHFAADVTLDRTKPLDPLEVYETAISAISNLGQAVPWDYDGFKRADASSPGTHIELMFRSLTTPQSRNRLQAGHIVLGMYQAVNLMARESIFCEAYVTLSSYRQRVGKVSFSRKVHGTALVGGNLTEITSVATDASTKNGDSRDDTNGKKSASKKRSNPYDFPQIIDPDDPNLKLTYNFNGPAINRDDVLSATLDAMATIAKPGPVNECPRLDAYSVSGGVVIHITPFDASTVLFTCGKVGRALTLIWDNIMLQQNRWAEISFELWYGKEPFAMGFVSDFGRGEIS